MSFLLTANWKMNLGLESSAALCTRLAENFKSLKKSEIWLAPSFPAISEVKKAGVGSDIKVGAQNAHWAESGAFTGEVSCAVLKECGAEFVIIGHSERRHIFHETCETAFQRAEAVVNSQLTLIFCIGETLEEREAGKTETILANQLSKLPVIHLQRSSEVILAYEPVWAIGTGKTANVKEIAGAHAFIKHFWLAQKSGPCPRILYGGSVTSENIGDISKVENVAGALIGGASNSYSTFSAIIEKIEG
jgi:triosephosphate isomerase